MKYTSNYVNNDQIWSIVHQIWSITDQTQEKIWRIIHQKCIIL